jgi:hypothetical protein
MRDTMILFVMLLISSLSWFGGRKRQIDDDDEFLEKEGIF